MPSPCVSGPPSACRGTKRISNDGGPQVADIAELVHLAHMPQLRVLSLVDNPCVAATPDYRARVRQK